MRKEEVCGLKSAKGRRYRGARVQVVGGWRNGRRSEGTRMRGGDRGMDVRGESKGDLTGRLEEDVTGRRVE